MIGNNLEAYSFKYLLDLALSQVPSTVDKRQGSIIYDALAPACYVLAKLYQDVRTVYRQTFVETCTGEALDLRAGEQGLTREPATYSERMCVFMDSNENPIEVPIGSRFSTVETNSLVFEVTQLLENYTYVAKCETAGSVGNLYVGALAAISNVPGLASGELGPALLQARDAETDEELRTRYYQTVQKRPFGGNIADYVAKLKELEGVGAVQVYSAWDGGGSVKCVILDSDYNACDPSFVSVIQGIVDPVPGEGLGLAPICHTVTIDTASDHVVNVTANIVLDAGVTTGQVQSAVEAALEEYLFGLRKLWEIGDELNNYALGVYLSRAIVAILSVDGIANVTSVTFNGSAADITLSETSTLQEIPVLGTVTLNA